MVMSSFVFLSSFASAAPDIIITEVELNPEGTDSGNEWVELYSDEDVDLDGYYLQNDDGDIFNLSGYEIDKEDYLVIELDGLWLDNNQDEVVYLRDVDDNIIDDTDELNDDDNDDRTWTLCDGDWVFIDESKGDDNDNKCEDEGHDPNEFVDDDDEDDDEEEEEEDPVEDFIPFDDPQQTDDNEIEVFVEVSENEEPIVLGNQITENEKLPEPLQETASQYISKQEQVKFGVLISFIVIAAFIAVFLGWRRF